jgi:hypothetical protein
VQIQLQNVPSVQNPSAAYAPISARMKFSVRNAPRIMRILPSLHRKLSQKKILSEPDAVRLEPKKQRLEESIERREKMHMAIVILGCVFVAFRLFTDMGSPQMLSAQQVQQEKLGIEQRTLCIQVFWEIAAILQSGEEPESSLRCEETPAINIVTRTDDDIVIRHPNPRILGFSDLYVSRSNPTPTALVL